MSISFRFLFHLAVLQLNILFTFGHKKIVDFLQQTEREGRVGCKDGGSSGWMNITTGSLSRTFSW